jgi:glycosyltransferase involved in cell wall biosynthesis
MLILSHPTGNANVRETARALNEAGLLAEFWTSIYWRQENRLNRVLPGAVGRELNRRSFSHLSGNQVHSNPWLETGRLLSVRLGLSKLNRHETGIFSVDTVYGSLDRKLATALRRKNNVRAVYAYEDGALNTFQAARARGLKTIYELPIGYWKAHQELLNEEAVLQPEWAMTLRGKTDSQEKLHRKDEELALADHIIVPSQFVHDTLSKASSLAASINVIPYGAPPVLASELNPTAQNSKLKVIFVGMLSQRKGLSYLIDAVQRLGPHLELTLIGRRIGDCKPLDKALEQYHWIPSLSHDQVLQEIRRHDVMVFPSLFEGFGLVVLEAMSCGVPVIATPQGGAPDFLSDGEDGFLVPIRDAEAIAGKLEILMHDRNRLFSMSQAAMCTAIRHSWESYRKRLVHTVEQTLNTAVPADLNMSWSPDLGACNQC